MKHIILDRREEMIRNLENLQKLLPVMSKLKIVRELERIARMGKEPKLERMRNVTVIKKVKV